MIRRIAFAALLVMAAGEKHSGYQDASPETRAMQDDDASNPGFLWVQQGETLWNERIGAAGRSCADCHGAAPVAMRGVATRYPLFDARIGRPVTLAQRIEQCRVDRQEATPLPADSDALLGLTAYVGLQSRGLPMQVAVDGPARPFLRARSRCLPPAARRTTCTRRSGKGRRPSRRSKGSCAPTTTGAAPATRRPAGGRA